MFSNLFPEPIFSLEGRINRAKFLLWFIIAIAYLAILAILGTLFDNFELPYFITNSKYAMFFIGILICSPLVLFVTKCIQRCHDLGVSGVYMLIPFFFLFMFFTVGQFYKNQYGENPLKNDENKVSLLNRGDISIAINQTGVFKIFILILFLVLVLGIAFYLY